MKIPDIKLNDKNSIPQIGLGLWQVKDAEQFAAGFQAAIKAGYRHFDSAQIYKNEQMLGEQWQASGVKREDLFLTTKIWIENFGHKRAVKSFDESLEKLQTDYVDLLLLHFPLTILRKKAWQALEEIQAAGGAKSIGVSNYTIRHLEEMQNYAKVMPAINQVELHVFLQQPELVKYCREHDIVIEAYSPLAHAKAMDNDVIAAIAKKHDKTYAQVMLRWCVENNFVVLPKSVTPSRIEENIDIFDFQLDDEDMETIAAQDQNMRTAWSPVHVP
ncbi:MAG TPA: aldo/keto reductase [Candidatus Dormibacteraeota bacterium]|nr:aldo/keto reductase [Candidatus Dormibacteraeota bacterium]